MKLAVLGLMPFEVHGEWGAFWTWARLGSGDHASHAIVAQMKADEAAHAAEAVVHGATELPALPSAHDLVWAGSQPRRARARRVNGDPIATELETRIEFLQTVWYETRRAGLDTTLVLGHRLSEWTGKAPMRSTRKPEEACPKQDTR